MTHLHDGDLAHLVRALIIAQYARWRTAPNPQVGCVIAHGDAIVAEGVTRPAGGPHAEVVALERAGERARGATAYVTLSPCAHHGRTPPCVEALLAAEVGRVVIGIDDPHPVASGGIAQLRAAQVPVTMLPRAHLVAAAIRAQLAAFLTVVTYHRPAVTLKIAQTLGGNMQSPDGRWITSAKARQAVHRLRDNVDAVLVGSGTVLADDPRLNVRGVAHRIMEQPKRVILDRRLRTPPTAAVARPGTLIMTRVGHAPAQLAALRDTGATVVELEAGIDASGATRPPGATTGLQRAIATLTTYGINSVLAEPGPTLAQELLNAQVVDRMVVHVADDGTGFYRPALASHGLSTTFLRLGGAGPDVIIDQLVHHHHVSNSG